jgi:hypothetical protein
MAFRSKAQRRKFAELLVKGEISDEVYERWNKETGGSELPERVDPKKNKAGTRKRRPKAARKPKRASTAGKTTAGRKAKRKAKRKTATKRTAAK